MTEVSLPSYLARNFRGLQPTAKHITFNITIGFYYHFNSVKYRGFTVSQKYEIRRD